MRSEELSLELQELQEELASLRAAEQHVQDKINNLLAQLQQSFHNGETTEQRDLSDLPQMLRRFEADHPDLTDSINRVLVTLSNMGI